MKRETVLKVVNRFLTQNDLNGQLFEILINPQERPNGFPPITKRRSVFIVNLNDYAAFADFCAHRHLTIADHQIYQNPGAILTSRLINLNDNSIENNWRGRILRFGQTGDFTLETAQPQFEQIFLKSFWRLIISYVGNEYFGKHDIVPLFYHPGSSVGGSEDFMYAVEGIAKFLDRGRAYGRPVADPDYDYVKVFGIVGQKGRAANVPILGNAEMSTAAFLNQINQLGVDAWTDNFYQEIDQNWHRG